MKKTLFTLSTIALITSAAQAYTFVDNKDTGTKLEFLGSARIKWNSTSDKTEYANGTTDREHVNHAVANNGSRFGFRITQQITNGFYALGRVEWRFRETASRQHDFGDIYARQLYAGIGHQQYGELTYGNQTVITDDVKQTDLPNTLSLSDGLLVGSARESVQYAYTGIENLKLGIFYGADSDKGNNGLTLTSKRKDVWGFGAIYKHEIDEQQHIKIGSGMTRERFQKNNANTYDQTAYALGTAYTFDKTTLGLDLERRVTHDQDDIGSKRTQKEIRTVIYHRITDDWRAYTMYAYKTNKRDRISRSDLEEKAHEFMLGTEYYIVPEYLKTFVEWKTAKVNNYTNGVKVSKERNNETVIGLRAYW